MGLCVPRPTTTMNGYLALAALLSLAALSWGQIITPYECHCGVFVSYPLGEFEAYHMKSAHVNGCGTEESVAACMQNCRDEWTGMYKNGDLEAELSNGYNLGQEICLGALEFFHPFVSNGNGQVFARNCQGNWEDIDLGVKQPICCNNGHYHEC